ncbi:MAG: MgtC/SapB family protein [Deltaproteobacteria bacterium]|nr:MgtC/SapB family protein [Deltaproteobacteria bacterium]
MAIALVLGGLVGVEREHALVKEGQIGIGGIRTFPLFALLGAIAAFASQQVQWFFLASFLVISTLLLISYYASSKEDPGMTTELSALTVFLIGGLTQWGHIHLGAALAIVLTAILALKKPLHEMTARLGEEDLYATLKFVTVVIIVLPLLPDNTYGPLSIFNPYKMGLMIVLIATIGFVGFFLIRMLGARLGIILTGLLGGLVSSTAVTLSCAERSRQTPALSSAYALATGTACAMMFPRVLLEAFVVNPALAKQFAIPIAIVSLTGIIVIGLAVFRVRVEPDEEVAVTNPFRLMPAVKFGLMFTGILFLAKLAQMYLGNLGVYIASAAAGLTDVDAITLSMARLSLEGQSESPLSSDTALTAILLATAVNTGVKASFALSTGAPEFRRAVLPIFLALLIGLVVGYATYRLVSG